MDGFSEAINAVSLIGYPAVTCWFVLYRIDYSIRKLEKTVYDLARTIAGQNNKEA